MTRLWVWHQQVFTWPCHQAFCIRTTALVFQSLSSHVLWRLCKLLFGQLHYCAAIVISCIEGLGLDRSARIGQTHICRCNRLILTHSAFFLAIIAIATSNQMYLEARIIEQVLLRIRWHWQRWRKRIIITIDVKCDSWEFLISNCLGKILIFISSSWIPTAVKDGGCSHRTAAFLHWLVPHILS